jgi:hypothetical protein
VFGAAVMAQRLGVYERVLVEERKGLGDLGEERKEMVSNVSELTKGLTCSSNDSISKLHCSVQNIK